jgi:FMN reductase
MGVEHHLAVADAHSAGNGGHMALNDLRALGIVGSITSPSRGRRLVERTLALLSESGASTTLLDLNDLPADALLGRRRDAALDAAIEQVAAARVLVLGTPTYRATYSGLLKTFFDLLPRDALVDKVVGAVATASIPQHALLVDHGLRPLVASLGGLSASRLVYVTDADYPSAAEAEIPSSVVERLAALAEELALLGSTLAAR